MSHNHETTLRVSRDLAVSRNTMVAAKHPGLKTFEDFDLIGAV